MKLVFAGTPEFAAVALRALLGAGFDIPLVLTQPDRPAGRGLKLQPSAVKSCAVEAGIEVAQPRGLRLDGRWAEDAQAAREALLQVQPDVMVVAAYGLILPRWALDLPRRGCVNIHASLLPRWRGAAPIHRAIEAGDTLTGITIMQMDEGLDTGDILMMRSMAIEPHDTTASLHDRLAVLGGELVVQSLRALEEGSLEARPQPAEGVTYARKIEKAEALLDWSLPASVLSSRIRAFDPFPGLVFSDGREPIKLWAARMADGGSPALDTRRPGEILAIGPQGVQVRCAQAEILELQTLQRPGGRRLPAVAVAQALGWQVGQRLDAPVADR